MDETCKEEHLNDSFAKCSLKENTKAVSGTSEVSVGSVNKCSVNGGDNETKSKMVHTADTNTKSQYMEWGKNKKMQEKFAKAYENWKIGKAVLNMVVVGHVDAGKSTIMGNLLFQIGDVDKKLMHKYKQESQKIGKGSFAYAWVLDEDQEERSRGVTIDVAQRRFETANKIINLMDAPGHKDFVPNMILGASQADFAVLVVNAAKGEFESGLESGGQTREHTILLKSLGLNQLIVAVNKMDMVEWDKERFEHIKTKMTAFLKSIGFKMESCTFVPCSGLLGQNLREPLTDVGSWYTGSPLLDVIDKIEPPSRMIESSLRMCISDVFKDNRGGFCVSGRIENGVISSSDSIIIMPSKANAVVKSISIDEPVDFAFPGEIPTVTLSNVDQKNVYIGYVICHPNDPIPVASRFKAQLLVFGKITVIKGMSVIFFNKITNLPATVRKIESQLDKSGLTVVKSRPRFLTKGMNGIVEIQITDGEVCVELFSKNRELSRFMLRYDGDTIASGVVQEIRMEKDNPLHLSWYNGAWFAALGQELNFHNALDYFCQVGNPFYDRNCINEQVKMQRLSPEAFSAFTGTEYTLLYHQDPILFVIRKRCRSSPTITTPMNDYYIIAPGHIYQSPDFASFLGHRLGTVSYLLRSAFEQIFPYISHSTGNTGYSWLSTDSGSQISSATKQAKEMAQPTVFQQVNTEQLIKWFIERPSIKSVIENVKSPSLDSVDHSSCHSTYK